MPAAVEHMRNNMQPRDALARAHKEQAIARWLWLIVLLLPLTTLVQGLPGLDAINRALVVILCAVLFCSYAVSRYSVFHWMLLLLTFVLLMAGFLVTGEKPINTNVVVYLPMWTLLFSYATENDCALKDVVQSKIKWADAIAKVWCTIVLVSIPLPMSWHSSWGGDLYFSSFTDSAFRLCPAALFIMLILTFCVSNRRRSRNTYLLLSLIPLFCGFMGGSRTYFVVICIAFFVFLWFYCANAKRFRVLLLCAIAVGTVLVSYSGVGSKISATQYTSSSYFDFWGTVTNSRTVLWAAELRAISRFSLTEWLIGAGFNRVYYINAEATGATIWAHNDYLNIMISNGLVGLFVYFASAIPMFRHRKYLGSSKRNGGIIGVAIIFIWLFNAFFNMCYTYTCSVLYVCFAPLVFEICEQQLRYAIKSNSARDSKVRLGSESRSVIGATAGVMTHEGKDLNVMHRRTGLIGSTNNYRSF